MGPAVSISGLETADIGASRAVALLAAAQEGKAEMHHKLARSGSGTKSISGSRSREIDGEASSGSEGSQSRNAARIRPHPPRDR